MTPLTNIPFQYISPSSPSHFSFSLQGHFRCYIRRLGRTHDIYPSFAHLHRQLFFLIFHILLLPIICSIIVSSTSSCFISSLWLFCLLKLHERSSLYKAKMWHICVWFYQQQSSDIFYPYLDEKSKNNVHTRCHKNPSDFYHQHCMSQGYFIFFPFSFYSSTGIWYNYHVNSRGMSQIAGRR